MRRLSALALPAACLLMAGCYEPVLTERVVLHQRADGALQVEVLAAVRETDDQVEPDAVDERAQALRAELERDGLGWPKRLAALEPDRRRSSSEHEADELRERRFSALVEDPRRAEGLFAEGLVRMRHEHLGNGLHEMVLVVDPGSRATRRQRGIVAEREATIASAYLDYLESAERFARLLDERPDRAALLLEHLLAGAAEIRFEGPDRRELDEREEALVDEMEQALDGVMEAFGEQPEGEQQSVDELSRLVHDPFAFELLIELPAPAVEAEGFLVSDGGRVMSVPRPSLTEALETLSSRWLEPDWLMELWTGPWRHEGTRLDYATLAARPRRAAPPASVAELREALVAELQPPKLYRVRWRSQAPPEGQHLDWSGRPQR